jgi:hypothetical protein
VEGRGGYLQCRAVRIGARTNTAKQPSSLEAPGAARPSPHKNKTRKSNREVAVIRNFGGASGGFDVADSVKFLAAAA